MAAFLMMPKIGHVEYYNQQGFSLSTVTPCAKMFPMTTNETMRLQEIAERIYLEAGVHPSVLALSQNVIKELQPIYAAIDQRAEINQLRVLRGFQKAMFSESALGESTGYGYNDRGRDQLEDVFAYVFDSEAALVRMQFSSGTHVLATCLKGLLRPGDDMLNVSGTIYDTLQATLGVKENSSDVGSLRDFGIRYRELPLTPDGYPDLQAIEAAILPETKLVYIQKSRGYVCRRALDLQDIQRIVDCVRKIRDDIVIMVDNCYGEFVEIAEPCSVGADLCAGSLIKNPGAGIAPTGGYVVGREDLVERVAMQMTRPVSVAISDRRSAKRACLRKVFIWHAARRCRELENCRSLRSAFSKAGYRIDPAPDADRADIVQTIEPGTPEN